MKIGLATSTATYAFGRRSIQIAIEETRYSAAVPPASAAYMTRLESASPSR